MDDVIYASATALAAGDGRAWVRRLLAKAGTIEVHPWLAANISQSQDMAVAAFTDAGGALRRPSGLAERARRPRPAPSLGLGS